MGMRVRTKRGLVFSPEEYQGRLNRLRAEMALRGLRTMLVHTAANVYYLTGYQTFSVSNYQCLAVPAEGEPFLVVRLLESEQARASSWLDDFVLWGDIDDPVAVTVKALKEWGLARGRIGLEESSSYVPARSAYGLRNSMPEAELVDGSGSVEMGRRVKSAEELKYMRKAAKITSAGMQAAMEEISEGKTENDVAAAAFSAMVRGGSEFMAADPIVTSGPRSGIAHTTFKRRVLQGGDAVLLEIGGCYNRYFAPLMRGVVLGRADDRLKRMADACIRGLNAAIRTMRPGATAGEVDEACRTTIERAGFEYNKRTGYSVGIGFPPTWMEAHIVALKRDDPTVLEPGMTFHMPPALRELGAFGTGFSETVAVTGTGCEVLTSFERELLERPTGTG